MSGNPQTALAHADTGAFPASGTEAPDALERRLRVVGQVRGDRVLDVGTGDGALAVLLAREGIDVLGIDSDGQAIARARARRRDEPRDVQRRLGFRHGTLGRDGEAGQFETVVLGEVLLDAGNAESFVRAALSHLTPGGRLIVVTPFGPGAAGNGRAGFFPADIHALLSPHGRITHMSVEGGYIHAVLHHAEAGHAEQMEEAPDLLALTEEGAEAAQAALLARIAALEAEADAPETGEEDRLAQELARARSDLKDAQRDKARAQAEIEALTRRIERLDRDAAPRQEGPGTHARTLAWARALPLPVEDIARSWTALARRLEVTDPDQALELMQAAHDLHPSPLTARRLGFALIERGDLAAGLELVAPLAEGCTLSSREIRLLGRARDGETTPGPATHSTLRVATIMDEFTYNCYAPECDLQQLSVNGWQDELTGFAPELLLIESAWRGLGEEWGAKVGHLSAEVRGILAWCRENGVPTAFWNKEDPVHFETFLATAREFDAVFTTDIDCIARYKAALGHERAWFLPFACQPETHNPIEITERKPGFCFAGAYYARYPDRTRDLDDFLDHLGDYGNIEIFDRNFGKDHPDYMFPEAYRHHIVGTLAPHEIDRAYKGYEFGINLNSVKRSQSMYARRVYELLASNTRVVSNYSPGLRLMFADLVVCTDSGAEAVRRIRRQDEAGHAPRIRLAALRKVLDQHTYQDRLAYVAEKVIGALPDPAPGPAVTVLARAGSGAEMEGLTAAFARQVSARAMGGMRMIVVAPDDVADAAYDLPEGVRCLPQSRAAGVEIGDLVAPDGWIAGFVPGDHYGAHYLADMALATRYSAAGAIGKGAWHHHADGTVTLSDGPVYAATDALALRRTMLRAARVADRRLDHWLDALPQARLDAADGALLAIDPFNYCQDGAAAGPAVAETVDDLPGLAQGMDLPAMLDRAERTPPARELENTHPAITGAEIAAGMPPQKAPVSWQCDGTHWTLTGSLPDGKHHYIYETGARPLAEMTGPEGLKLYLDAGPGYYMVMVVVFLDAAKAKIDNARVQPGRNTTLEPPEGTEFIRLGFRVLGSGSRTIHRLILGEHHSAPRDILPGARTLILTNHYPSYDDLYRNGFVHSRVRAYREMAGITPDIYRLRPEREIDWHEFQNIDCMTGSAEQLDHMLASGDYDHVLVHFLDPEMWQVLRRHVARIRVTVWVHGAEVQPWWRRSYNYTTDAELEKAKTLSDARLAFWRGLFDPLPENLRFVFVSQYFADEVMEDLGVTCPPGSYEVIHNPIDDQVFAYHEKPDDQRGKVLSIRPFASATYANDLSVKAILALRDRPFFDDLEFRIIGDGPLFDDITAPLAGLANVTCEKRFLLQDEIAALHREHGVFLNPSRMDTQGVSRDEAMSSGLVPVTSRVAAIPEFVDETCGYLAEGEDHHGLADAIVDLWQNPETFQQKSRAAAERVRRQSAKERVIRAELALFASSELERT